MKKKEENKHTLLQIFMLHTYEAWRKIKYHYYLSAQKDAHFFFH